MASPIKKVINRVKTIAREVRDIPTAYVTTLVTQQDYRGGNPKDRPKLTRNVNQASKNLDRQIAEAAKAVLTGKSGTSSDKSNKYGKYKAGKMR